VIVGNGVAGRAMTAMLLKRPYLWKSLTVIDSALMPPLSMSAHAADLHTGLWSPSVKILNDELTIPYEKWLELACPVLDSGYRSTDGRWLMKPRVGMRSPPGKQPFSRLTVCLCCDKS
jgi:hypothetical protein